MFVLALQKLALAFHCLSNFFYTCIQEKQMACCLDSVPCVFHLRESDPFKLNVLFQPNREGILELSVGGVFYCLGIVFFKSDGLIPFAHAIWHVFVAVGAGIHYYAIWRYLYTTGTSQIKNIQVTDMTHTGFVEL